jgi:hypothetical protein
MNLHPTKKESKQSEGSLFKKDSDQLSAVKRSLPNCHVDWKVTLQPQLGKFARNVSISTTIIGSFSSLTPISNGKSAPEELIVIFLL